MTFWNNFKKTLVHYTWDLAYFDFNSQIITQGIDFNQIHIVRNPFKKKWFADPFILKESECELTLLVEEFDQDVKRGRIAQIVVDKSKNLITSCDIILDLPTHLSFPAIYRVGDKIFVHPENSASGASFMYEYDELEKKLINPIKVIDEPLTDAVIIKDENGFKLFSTTASEPNGSNLKVFISSNFLGPYEFFNAKHFPYCRARMAGKCLEYKGEIIRPAQDCEGAYGKAVIFYNGHKELGEIRPNQYKYAGVHTFNKLNNTCIIDIKRFDYPLFVLIKNQIKRLMESVR